MCIVSLFGGGLFALIVPTLSVYLAEHLNVKPFLVGSFFVAMSATSIVFAQVVGHWSDKLGDRRHIILIGMSSGALACIVFAFSNNYLMVLFAGLTFFAFSLASTSQMLAITREYADQFLHPDRNALFNSIVRACVAVSWVGGPPLGFYFFTLLGPKHHYLLVGFCYFAVGLCGMTLLPKVQRVTTPPLQPAANRNRTLTIAILAFALLYSANQTYIICLPLFLAESMATPSSQAGWIYGTAAGLEVPVMILAGWLTSRFSLLMMIRVGAFSAALLYSGFFFATELWQLFALQIFNAIFIGTLAGLGMTWFQNMMPGKTGTASAMFVNTISAGNVIGSSVVAVVAQWFGYHSVYAVNIFIALIALVLLITMNSSIGHRSAQLNTA